jgi:NAD(P)-dependent dehydrogenase (short-subunit alcohol dehydrogenase family)
VTELTAPDIRTHEYLNSQSPAAATAKSRRSIIVKVNITSTAAVKNLVTQTVSEYGRLDILVTNIVILAVPPANRSFHDSTKLPRATWDADMAVNARGIWLGSKYGIAEMLKQKPYDPTGDRGWIVKICSIVGFVGFPCADCYIASSGGNPTNDESCGSGVPKTALASIQSILASQTLEGYRH